MPEEKKLRPYYLRLRRDDTARLVRAAKRADKTASEWAREAIKKALASEEKKTGGR